MKNLGKVYFVLFLKLGIAFWLFSFCRLLFYLFNLSAFPNVEFIHFLGGMRFDWMTITILYCPFLFAFLVIPTQKPKVLAFLFYFSSILSIILNFIDFEYFKFTSKRSTSDLFTSSGMQDDILNLLPTFLVDFWYILIIGIITFLTLRFFYKKTEKINLKPVKFKHQLLLIIPLLLIYLLGSRGGIQLRPLGVLNASQYASAQYMSLVLNTPFTMLKSSYKKGIEPSNYFANEELEAIYSPVQNFTYDSSSKKLNVVLIILESFSEEYIGVLNNDKGYTPFLDSLIGESICFPNSFANGKRSIEGLPAILSGIPSLMSSSYIASKYASNTIQSLASVLSNNNYSTSFYHGGANGTMGFKAFTQIAGIDNYIGKDEYPDIKDYDGNWGIFDEPFLQYCITDFNQTKEPFFSSIFTLSSHHPYTIPEKHKGKFEDGPIPILKAISYSDYALKQFFRTAEKQSWFKNTLFVITADHTQHNYLPNYNNQLGFYSIPLLFYSPTINSVGFDSTIAQQNDIFPSVIDYLGLEENILSFGSSVFDKNKEHYAISYLNGVYQFIYGDYCLHFDGKSSIALYQLKSDPELKKNIIAENHESVYKLERLLKGIIQQYQERVINNKLVAE